MDKKNSNIFISDVEIPDIVQQKANLAFSQIREEKVKKMNNNIIKMEEKKSSNLKKNTVWKKAIVAVAACATLMTVAGVSDFYVKNKQADIELAENKDVSNGTIGKENSLFNTNPFILTVHAAGLDGNETRELKSGTPVAIDVNVSGWVLGANDMDACYCINLPISCEGENIESITYSINKGAFQVVEKEDASIIIEGKEVTESINAGQIGGDYDEENDGLPRYPISVKYYSEITLSYDKQCSDTTWINMCNDKIQLSDENLIWGDNATLEERQKAYEELISGVVITCTVNFQDGTSQSTDLEIGTVLTTAKEAGFEDASDSDEEEVFFTFERK